MISYMERTKALMSPLTDSIQLIPNLKMYLTHRWAVRMDGWMTCDTSFLTVFESYQDDVLMIMKAVCNGTPFTVEKIAPRAGIELGPLDQ